ncbi:hypothetical protein GWI33_004298 [Rhynchophorus ferrugineus]|uniref:CWH43-like N-terminal domain-containing protein n=1 Tax=Rhynchophorus ferrugineus TaxID=354439 RepID=A0A834IMG8_RHYFE|nr:hypothetical protein GWI33_004298 [Rhynchophorus ferrugineus]
MPCKYIHILPIIEGLWHTGLFMLTYTLAVLNKDVPAIMPFVSDTGAHSLQKCIFSFGIVIGAILVFMVMYIRHIQVKDILKMNNTYDELLFKLNRLSLIYASCTSFGLIILGTIPVLPYFYFHTGVGFVTFAFAMVTIHAETYISCKLYPRFGSKRLNKFRIVLSVILPIAMFSCAVTLIPSVFMFDGTDKTQWTDKHKGYKLHVISATFEWISTSTAFCIIGV